MDENLYQTQVGKSREDIINNLILRGIQKNFGETDVETKKKIHHIALASCGYLMEIYKLCDRQQSVSMVTEIVLDFLDKIRNEEV